MGMEAAVGWLVGWRINGGEIGGGKTKGGKKGGSNDAFTFKSYFNSCLRLERKERKAYPATFIGQYFLRLIGCTCSVFPLSLSENKQLCHRGNEQSSPGGVTSPWRPL